MGVSAAHATGEGGTDREGRHAAGIAHRTIYGTSTAGPAATTGIMSSDPRFAGVTRTVGLHGSVLCVNGTPVRHIAEYFKAGESIAALARGYRCTTHAIESAIRCALVSEAEVDREIG